MSSAGETLAGAIREWAELHPRSTRIYRRVLRHRMLMLGILAALTGWMYSFPAVVSRDLRLFSTAGRSLLSLDLAEVYSQPEVQIGPLSLLLSGVNDLFARSTGLRLELGMAISVAVGVTMLSVFAVRRMHADLVPAQTPPPGFELFFGCVVILGGICYEATTSAHPTEAVIPILWILAAQQARHGKGWRAGALIAAAGLLKAWGALGLPLLLLAPRKRSSIVGVATLLALTAIAYLPFLVTGRTSTLSFSWVVKPQSPLRLFLEPGTAFPWSMRIIQAVLMVSSGAGLVMWSRGRAQGWMVGLAMVSVRLLTDPLDYHYYWLPVGVLVLCGLSTIMPLEPTWWRVPFASAFYVTLLPFFSLKGLVEAWYIAIASLTSLTFAIRATRMDGHRALA